MKHKKMSLGRLAAKVAWEGGIINALDYGIRSVDVEDADVARHWAELERLYERMIPLLGAIDRRIREARAA